MHIISNAITIVSLCHASNFSFADPLFIIILQCCFYGCRDCSLFFIWKNRIYFVRLPVLFCCVHFHFGISSSLQRIDSAFSSTDKDCCMLVFSSMLDALLAVAVVRWVIKKLHFAIKWFISMIMHTNCIHLFRYHLVRFAWPTDYYYFCYHSKIGLYFLCYKR